MSQQLRLNDYTVGWVCALSIELAAAQKMLDKEHEDGHIEIGSNDENVYTLGSIGGHNVAIVCLPAGQNGRLITMNITTQMRRTFKNIRFALTVGIGSGVPTPKYDIRLGDVVVSLPGQRFGGALQYDPGTTTLGEVERAVWLKSPHHALRAAITRVRTQEAIGESKLSEFISVLERNVHFQRSKAGIDVLFEAAYDYEGDQTCEKCSADR